MGLELPGLKNIFPHSRRVETGLGKERVGQATVIVAVDGSGDAATIQEGIDLLPSTGGGVYIKEGTYVITSSIKIGVSNTSLIGVGKATKITTTSNINMITATSLSGLLINKIFLSGAGTGNLGNRGILFTTVTDSVIEACIMDACGGHGIQLDNNANNNIITENISSNNFRTGILTSTSTENIISDNQCNSNAQGNMEFISADNCVISGNQCNSGTLMGMDFLSSDRNVISGNRCNTNVKHGMIFDSSNNNIIEGNQCNDNDSADTTTFSGIFLDASCDNNIISSNRCSGNDNYGINISASTNDKTLAHGNHLLGNTTGALNDGGTNTTSADNITT